MSARRTAAATTIWMLAAALQIPGLSSGTEAAAAGPGGRPTSIELLEAVRATLQQSPNIQLQERQVDFNRGVWQSAAGQFDPMLETALSRGVTHTSLTESERLLKSPHSEITELVEDVTSYRLGLSKQFRSGPTISPGLELSRVEDNADRERAANLARVSFALKVPLVRGRGQAVVAAPERAALANVEAARLDLRHTTAQRLLGTVVAFWECRAALEQVDVLRESEERATNLVAALNHLVEAGELAATDLDQARADQEEKHADLLGGEQLLFEARQNLGLAMGLAAEALATPPLPRDPFPLPDDGFAAHSLAGGSLVARSLERRADYQSARKAERAQEILLVAARNNLKPQLDLNLEAGYTGLDEGSQFRSFWGGLDPWMAPGPNLLASLRLEWPIGNRAARGLFAQRVASHEQTHIRSQDLARTISSSIETTLAELRQAVEEWRRLNRAVDLYQRVVTNETEKLKLGNSTVLDRITVADRFSNTLVKRIAARARYAGAVARLRFETGLLVPEETGEAAHITAPDLVNPPALDDLLPSAEP